MDVCLVCFTLIRGMDESSDQIKSLTEERDWEIFHFDQMNIVCYIT